MAAPSQFVPTSLARPLGRGYDHLEHFLSLYISDGTSGPPTLRASLEALGAVPSLDAHFAGVDRSPVCLIEGIAAPGNGEALRSFLAGFGIGAPRILAIDLADIRGLFLGAGVALPGVEFHVADATDLRALYADGAIDIAVQDFLLNCAPHPFHVPILREMYRILRPGGLAIVSFTDHRAVSSLPAIAAAAMERVHNVPFRLDAYSLSDLEPNGRLNELRWALANTVVRRGSGQFTLITAPYGNFEFYRSREATLRLIRQAGFAVLEHHSTSGRDSNGSLCHRHRLVLSKPRENGRSCE